MFKATFRALQPTDSRRPTVRSRFGSDSTPPKDVSDVLYKALQSKEPGAIRMVRVTDNALIELKNDDLGRVLGHLVMKPKTDPNAGYETGQEFIINPMEQVTRNDPGLSEPITFKLIDAIQKEFDEKLRALESGKGLVIGSDPACDLVIPFPINNIHCRIQKDDDGCLKLRSPDGTWINEEVLPLVDSDVRLLLDGDKIQLGSPDNPKLISLTIPNAQPS